MAERLYDCFVDQGEVDNPLFGHWIKNDKFKSTRVLHNVSEKVAIQWHQYQGWNMVFDIEREHPDLYVCHYITFASND